MSLPKQGSARVILWYTLNADDCVSPKLYGCCLGTRWPSSPSCAPPPILLLGLRATSADSGSRADVGVDSFPPCVSFAIQPRSSERYGHPHLCRQPPLHLS